MPFFVFVHDVFVVADFDQSDGDLRARTLHREALLAGFVPVMCASRSGADDTGRRHVLIRAENDEDRRFWAMRAKELGADVKLTIRPPYARHRDRGHRSLPIYPSSRHAVIDRLTNPIRRTMPPSTRADIFELVGVRGSQSDIIRGFANYAASGGWTVDEALLVLHDERLAIGRTYAEAVENRHHPEDDWFRRHVWPTAHFTVRRLRAAAPCVLPKASTRPTDGSVYEAFLQLAEDIGSLVVDMSVRELQIRAEVGSPRTVIDSLRRLVSAGLLDVVGDGVEIGHARTYRLVVRQDLGPEEHYREQALYLPMLAFRNTSGFGAGVGLTYRAIAVSADGLTAAEAGLVSGFSRRTVLKHLGKLVELGLLVAVDGFWRTTDVSVADVTPKSAMDARDAAAQRHQSQRELYRQVIAERRGTQDP
ncbi:hypothetical protein ASG23_15365 [Cellulomonas sp. Leaf395]|nr:hypothetical protein ASG23_15365 [Cellulomonas sp. Leaf395]